MDERGSKKEFEKLRRSIEAQKKARVMFECLKAEAGEIGGNKIFV